MSEKFDERIDKILSSFEDVAQYEQAKRVLEEVCDSIQKALQRQAPDRRITVGLDPGWLVNLGQQLNVVVDLPERNFRDTLFRVYIPVKGYPVQLDFFGEEPLTANSSSEMENHIAHFLARPEVKLRLREYVLSALRKAQ